MIKIMFVCLGNICRSPMAEFLMKDYLEKKGVSANFLVKSSATSRWENGNPVHYGTVRVLDRLGISCKGKYSELLLASDYDKYDYFIGMDEDNRRAMNRLFGGDPDGKVSLLLDYTHNPRSVADPYYTDDFSATYNDVTRGIDAFYKFLQKQNKGV